MLDFELMPDNTIIARAVKPAARRSRGLLRSPQALPLTVPQMDRAVDELTKRKHAPMRGRRRKASDR